MSVTLRKSTSLLSSVLEIPTVPLQVCWEFVCLGDLLQCCHILTRCSSEYWCKCQNAELIPLCSAANRPETQPLHLVNKKAKCGNTTSTLNDGFDQAVELPQGWIGEVVGWVRGWGWGWGGILKSNESHTQSQGRRLWMCSLLVFLEPGVY